MAFELILVDAETQDFSVQRLAGNSLSFLKTSSELESRNLPLRSRSSLRYLIVNIGRRIGVQM
jgi:hypothetical protein